MPSYVSAVKIGETSCKSIINKSGIEGVDYAVNPYIGCAHACSYCYARFMTRWYHKNEKWGTFVDVKKNALECMKKEAPRKKPGVILFSSVTDAFQPVEKKTKLTRRLLEILTEYFLDFYYKFRPLDLDFKISLGQFLAKSFENILNSRITVKINEYKKLKQIDDNSILDRILASRVLGRNTFPMLTYLL